MTHESYALHVDVKMTLKSHNFFLMWNMTHESHNFIDVKYD